MRWTTAMTSAPSQLKRWVALGGMGQLVCQCLSDRRYGQGLPCPCHASNRVCRSTRASVTSLLLLAAWWLPGCQLLVDPWRDETTLEPPVTTASAELARAAETRKSERPRDFAAATIGAADGAVTHGPLYFEDPIEDSGSDNGAFAWTGEDYLQWVIGPSRFLVNTVLVPISMVDTPPWTVMSSDGEASRTVVWQAHDAGRWNGSAAP